MKMDLHVKTNKLKTVKTTIAITNNKTCSKSMCFFCAMEEPEPSLRRTSISRFFKEMPLNNNEEQVVVLSGLWNIAMTQPNNTEFPSLGIFNCVANLIQKGVNDKHWLLSNQNIYIPYYAAHIIGSFTMNKPEFAAKAVESGVVLPLVELLRGKISWVEQRVAVRALGHLASYERTFEALRAYEDEIVKLAMDLASSCFEVVYNNFVGVKDSSQRLNYHCTLLTRGIGGLETENRKAEEWACQFQSWCLQLLNCFTSKRRCLITILRNQEFLINVSEMWHMNHIPSAGIGLIRILCRNKNGRKKIAESKRVLENLGNISRSCDDCQYMAIDCLLLLLKDQSTRYQVIETATLILVDLIELENLGHYRSNVGETITRLLLLDYKQIDNANANNNNAQRLLKEVYNLKVERIEKERNMSKEELQKKRVMVKLIKQQGNYLFWLRNIDAARLKYNEAINLCPIKLRKERMVLYSNRAQCELLLGDVDKAISDSTKALCLSKPANSHSKSLWRRSQAYGMKGLGKESLLDCVMFLNCCVKICPTGRAGRSCNPFIGEDPDPSLKKGARIPYCVARMISKQMDATWVFGNAKLKSLRPSCDPELLQQLGTALCSIKEDPLRKTIQEENMEKARKKALQ